MADFDYDLFVIGAGSGGVRASRKASEAGARVAVAESGSLGGTCVNVGCVPKKLFVYGAHFAEQFSDAQEYGWQLATEPQLQWQTLREKKNEEIKRLNGIYQHLLNRAGVDIIAGRAKIVAEQQVEVAGKRYSAEKILIAVGGVPIRPNFPGAEHAVVSDDMFYLPKLPQKALILGGGYIAMEFAGILAGFGVQTTLLYRKELPLRGFDHTVREFICQQMRDKGIEILTNDEVAAVEKTASTLQVQLLSGKKITTELLLAAIGRQANTADLGLQSVNIAVAEKGAIKVDQFLQTSVPSIYALGDVIDRVQLTPVAIKEAMALVQTLYYNKPTAVNYDLCPKAVFTQPAIAAVGLTEEQARQQGLAVEVYTSTFRPLKLSLTTRTEKCLMKLLVEKKSNKVIGAHVVSEEAAEIIQGVAVAMTAGATKADFDATIGIHPSSAEELVTLQ